MIVREIKNRKLRASDYMIGNYVEFFKSIYIIESIRKDNTYYIGGKSLKTGSSAYSTIEAWKPIPLTEEWLVKLGFEKRIDGAATTFSIKLKNRPLETELFVGLSGKRVYLRESYSEHLKLQPELVCLSESVKSVHQLQNLYHALTGTELTLKQ